MSTLTPPPLSTIGSVFQGVRMICETKIAFDELISAYMAGIKIESVHINGEFEPGDVIEFPIRYLPWTDLPAAISFVRDKDKSEISTPFEVETQDTAIGLVGAGEISIEQIGVDNGSIRGIAANKTNGLTSPHMFARINGHVTRIVNTSHPRYLEDGGAMFRFAVQLTANDIREAGLTAEIFVVGESTPISSITYRRADLDELSRRIIVLEDGLRQVTKSADFKMSTLSTDIHRRMDVIQQRIDAFIEYSATFLFDRICASAAPQEESALGPIQSDAAKTRAFRDLVHAASADPATDYPKHIDAHRLSLPITSHCFSMGWYNVEKFDGADVRWMPGEAVIINPEPNLVIEAVHLSLRHVHEKLRPELAATFDSTSASVLLEDTAGDGKFWKVKIVPLDIHSPHLFQILRLFALYISDASGSKAAESAKIVSFAVSTVEFVYKSKLTSS